MGSFKDQTVIVTGGNTGIGKEICLQFASEKANVVVNYLFEEELAFDLVTHIEQLGGKAIAVKGDVSILEQAKNIV